MELYKIILYIIIGLVILLLIYTKIHNDIKNRILKINYAESEIDESLRLKYDLLIKLISEVKQVLKDLKDFDNVEDIKDEKLSSFEFERKLNDIELKLYNIKCENNKVDKNNEINDIWYQINNLSTKIKGDEKYYNENTDKYNNLVTKFPSNIVAKTMRSKEKPYFDGKDMYDKNIKDFKI